MGIGLLLAQRGGVYRLMERVLIAAGERSGASGLHAIAGLDRTLRELFRSSRVANGTTIHLVAWITSAVEVWLALYFMGHRIDFVRALVMESLGQLIRCLGFVVPGGLGVQEGGYLAIGAVLGVPPEAALAVSLVKRICQVVLGLPGLLSWQIAEARWLIHQRTKVAQRPRAIDRSCEEGNAMDASTR
jgi:uncharacterized membrane protein YbhN (UPF0104 family)